MPLTTLHDALAYIHYRLGCIHPFRSSRVLALAEIRCLQECGERLTEAVIRKGPGVIYIENLKQVIESDDCFKKHEGDPTTGRRGCIEYTCNPPPLPEKAKEALDKAIEETRNMDDMELNRLVVNHPLLERITGNH